MKKVLIIAYYYPPIAGGGVQRTAKFVKYLPECGWQPYVLTVKQGYDYYTDPTLTKDVSERALVFRTNSVEPMQFIRKLLKNQTEQQLHSGQQKRMSGGKIKKHPWLLLIKESIFIPDGEIGWLPFGVLKGLKIIKDQQIDLIYSTSCPYTDHLIAYWLKKRTDKPWLADFRDPWSLHMKAPQFAWRKFWDQTLEKRVLSAADRTITVTPQIAEDFRQIYPQGNYGVITNGYDDDDFQNIESSPYRLPKFTVTYTGILFKEQSPKYFLEAVAKLLSERPELKNDLRIRFIGQLDNPGETTNYNYLKQFNLGAIVEFIPYISHQKIINYLGATDVALLIVDQVKNSEGIMTGKIFEYLRSGAAILALVPPNGAAAEVVRETNSGLVVKGTSITGIKSAILELYLSYKNGSLSRQFKRQGIAKYNRRQLTQTLANEFEQLIQKV